MGAVRRIDRIDRLPFVVARVWAPRYQFFDHYCPVRCLIARLSPVWRQVKLAIITKVLLHNVLVISLLLYGCETWTLPVADEMKLEAFLMTCQRQILVFR